MDENKAELIDRYLDEELSSDEKASFEALLEGDSDLKLEVEAQNAVRNMIRQQGEKAALLRMFEGFHETIGEKDIKKEDYNGKIIPLDENLSNNRRSKKLFKIDLGNWSRIAVAASVALTILGVWTVVKDRNAFDGAVEIRNNSDDEALRIPFLTWGTVDGKPVLQDRKFIDLKITRKTRYKFHYRFKSFLEIYSDSLTAKGEKITLQFDSDSKVHKLWIGKKIFIIKKTEEIIPLQ